ncbi:putative lipolytic protein, GDSL family [Nocardia nova SH22a]|uniref:Putative lipolytic protein, GDSL family n=1 Tax=Nocardia nova SH22a TaxID=1415166 RepID=W5TQY6_9NOCA|nr:GDSL-type esterase/lipase family protein [Nocardia nova]AHH19661.1 putative lipolytic protein, GDSL family [Nocardia nova SH22a]
MRHGHRGPRTFIRATAHHARYGRAVKLAAAVALGSGLLAAPPVLADDAGCAAAHFVAGWTASPTDSITPLDPLGTPVPEYLDNQTVRMMITPHLGGSKFRLHLSNRFGSAPVTFGRVTIGRQTTGSSAQDPVAVTFGDAAAVTVPAGQDIVSDPVAMSFRAFDRLAVSIFLPAPSGPPTKHWNANATSYYSPPGSGDLTARTTDPGFSAVTNSWLYVDGLDVEAPGGTGSVVAFGDSITDGFVGGTPVSVPASRAAADVDGRYPDQLQRRLDAAGVPISVVNAGIGSNRLLTSGEPLMLGPRGLDRFRRDALDQPGVTGVLLLEGINDLGLPPGSSASAMIDGYRQAVDAAHAAGKKIWLGTILPAANALVDGTLLAPASETSRQEINSWIRSHSAADGVVDFDAALRDPGNSSILNPAYAGVDNLHPNLAGYQAMADAVPLDLLASAAPACGTA